MDPTLDTQQEQEQQQPIAATMPEAAEQAPTQAEQTATEVEQEPTQAEQVPAQTEQTATQTEQPPEAAAPAVDTTRQLMERVISAEVRAAAALCGVSAERLPYVVRMCDMSAAHEADADVAAIAREQVRAVLTAVPEMAGSPVSTGTLGDFKRSPAAAPKKNAAEMTDEEYYASLGK